MRLLSLLWISSLLLVSFQLPPNFEKEDLYGFWFWEMGSSYYEKKAPIKLPHAHEPLGFTFKKRGRLKACFCTDICGCLPKTTYGRWKWLGDGLVEIDWNGRKSQLKLQEQDGKMRLLRKK